MIKIKKFDDFVNESKIETNSKREKIKYTREGIGFITIEKDRKYQQYRLYLDKEGYVDGSEDFEYLKKKLDRE